LQVSTELKASIIDQVTAIAERVTRSLKLEVVEVELSGNAKDRILRVIIDKENSKPGDGVTLDDCEAVSQQVGTILDVEDVIPGGAYRLEISSPGVERKLLKERDYERFAGQKAKVILREPMEQAKGKVLIGRLAGCEGGRVRMTLEKGPDVEFPFERIDRANLKFDW
jgi:ribosome maturation factor RimP